MFSGGIGTYRQSYNDGETSNVPVEAKNGGHHGILGTLDGEWSLFPDHHARRINSRPKIGGGPDTSGGY